MKLTEKLFQLCKGVLVLSLCLIISTNMALAQSIKLDFKNTPLITVIKEIQSRSEYKFTYNNSLIDINQRVSINSSEESIEVVLKKLFEGTTISYKIIDKQIVLSPTAVKEHKKQVLGKVLDESGEPLPGVAVENRANGKWEITGEDGSFTIDAETDETLHFSMLGMESQDINIGGQSTISIVMKTDAILLDDVIATGYQTISKERTTGSFVKVTSEKIGVKRLNSIGTLLEGEVAGMNSGMIRGVTSMKGNTAPLYVIDGFPVENTNYSIDTYSVAESAPDINIEDIESITILKDASATSIYGARAANGVIVIETKRAKKNETNINFSTNIAIKPYRYFKGNVANAALAVELEREWANNNPYLQDPAAAVAYAQGVLDNATYSSLGVKSMMEYYAGHISQSQMEQQLNEYAAKGYSYLDDVAKYGSRNRFMQQYNISLSKGGDNNSFYSSFTYKNNKYESINTKDQSFGLNISNQSAITDWLKIDLGSFINYGNNTQQGYSLLNPGYNFSIYESLVNNDGSFYTKKENEMFSVRNLNTFRNYNFYNMDITPLDEINYNLLNGNSVSTRNYIRLNAQFTQWLKYSASFQYEYSRSENVKLGEKESADTKRFINKFFDYSGTLQLPYGDTYFGYNTSSRNYSFRHQLDFNKSINDKHNIVALAGMEVRDSKAMFDTKYYYGYDKDMLTHGEINAPETSFFMGVWSYGMTDSDVQRELVNRYVSLYANAAYSYDSKYVITGSVRWDRSNLWSNESKYQDKPAWSFGASWNVDREQYIKDIDWINMLKVRSSYGVGGNVSKEAAPYLTMSYSQNYGVGGLQGTVLGRPNPDLCWEMTNTFDFGVDFSLVNNRIYGSADYYYKRGSNLLANANGVPVEGYGYDGYAVNNGGMINKGVELSLNGVIVDTKDWRVTLGGMYSYNKNEVTYIDAEATVYWFLLDYASDYPRIGNPYHSIYGYKWAGLSNSGAPQIYDSQNNAVTYQPQDLESIVYLGTYTPTYFGSINLNVGWKNWNLSALMTYEGGHKIKNTNLPGNGKLNGLINSRESERWMKPGDEATTNVPRFMTAEYEDFNSESFDIYKNAEINMLNATNIKMRNLSLSYSLPNRVCKHLNINGLKIQLNGENLFTIAGSPEAKYMLNGYDSAIYSLGLQINL